MAVERRRRRNETQKSANHERWVISYADFMTLLLATFVVLYAVSSINVSRYRQTAEALSAVFTGKLLVQEKGPGAMTNGHFENMPAPVHLPVVRPDETKKGPPGVPDKVRERTEKLNQAYKNLSYLLKDVIDKGQVHIAFNGLSVVIDINASVLFESGKADLTTPAMGIIDQIGDVLKDLAYEIQVNGFTDNAPIHTAQFNSNWELSAMRSISVVKRFVNDGAEPSRLVGAGYGEYHPIATNDTLEGMSQNRRVSIVVVSADEAGHEGAVSLINGGKPEPIVDKGATARAAAPPPGLADRPLAKPALDPPAEHWMLGPSGPASAR